MMSYSGIFPPKYLLTIPFAQFRLSTASGVPPFVLMTCSNGSLNFMTANSLFFDIT